MSFTKGAHYFKLGYHYRFQYLFFGLQNRTSFSFTSVSWASKRYFVGQASLPNAWVSP